MIGGFSGAYQNMVYDPRSMGGGPGGLPAGGVLPAGGFSLPGVQPLAPQIGAYGRGMAAGGGGPGGLPAGGVLPAGGFSLPGVQPLAPQIAAYGRGMAAGGGGGGGWLGSIKGALDDMSGFEKAYLMMSGLGGVADHFWGPAAQDRKQREQFFNAEMDERRKGRKAMGTNLARVWGG